MFVEQSKSSTVSSQLSKSQNTLLVYVPFFARTQDLRNSYPLSNNKTMQSVYCYHLTQFTIEYYVHVILEKKNPPDCMKEIKCNVSDMSIKATGPLAVKYFVEISIYYISSRYSKCFMEINSSSLILPPPIIANAGYIMPEHSTFRS